MKIKINDYKIKVKPVSSKDEISRGMMGQKFGDKFLGMLFFLTPGPQSFWMKDCITDIDIIFINDSDEIVQIYHECPPCISEPCKQYKCVNASKVLELPGGMCKVWNISEGDNIKYL